MVHTLTNVSTFENIFQILTNLNITKIKLVKSKMNDLILKLDYKQSFNDLPPYLDYTLYLLNKSYKILNKYNNKIIQILLMIDKYDIHPSIIQSLYTNIIFSVYIDEILNQQLKTNQTIIESISNIYTEIDIIMSIFNDIFISVDTEYKMNEDKLCYNSISSLKDVDFLSLIDNLDNDIFKSILDKNIVLLNTMIIKVEHLTQDIMNTYLIKLNLEKSSNSKLDDDLLLSKLIIDEFNTQIINNYKYITRFETYNNMANIDILSFEQKNFIYYWIDYIALKNKETLELIFK